MKAKLIKVLEHYHLYDGDKAIATTIVGNPMLLPNLSLKNCQAIELGYNLDELAKEEILYNDQKREWWKQGFQKALELMGDKEFSVDDVKIAMLNAIQMSPYQGEQFRKDNDYHMATDIIQSLQQTEWDVEVEMRSKNIDELRESNEGFLNNSNLYVPKLDQDGCLIITRVWEK